MSESRAETVLQFGGGNFLRAFVDLFVTEANRAGEDVGSVVVVVSTDARRAAAVQRQHGRYHVVLRGVRDGRVIDEITAVDSISRAVFAGDDWDTVLDVAAGPDLRWIVSNTTEKGYQLDPGDRPDATPPRSFPAKLLQVLRARSAAGRPPVAILPCELHPGNADRLRDLVSTLASRWQLDDATVRWCIDDCDWRNTLVDRIVSGRPEDHPLLAEDELLTVAEPYALWVIEDTPNASIPLFRHPAIERTTDVGPYDLRKVRILNGTHTALVAKGLPRGLRTVREALADPAVGRWARELLFEEIVPAVAERVADAERYAHETLERLANPHLDHKLADIALHHDTKVQVRLEPTRREYLERYGREPDRLCEAIAERL